MHVWCKYGDPSKNLWRVINGQAEFSRILSQNGQNDLEDQGQWLLFSIPIESIPWYMFGTNLVIPDQICNELSCGQGKVYGQTEGHLYCIFDISIRKYEIRKLYCLLYRHVVHKDYMQQSYYRQHITIHRAKLKTTSMWRMQKTRK